MSSLAIIDEIQSKVNPKAALSGFEKDFSQTGSNIGEKLKVDFSGLQNDEIDSAFENIADQTRVGAETQGQLPAAPFSVEEVQANLRSPFDSFKSLDVSTLTQGISSNHARDVLGNDSVTKDVQNAAKSLTDSLTANFVSKPDLSEFSDLVDGNPFDEFKTLLSNVGDLPTRVLDAIVNSFKKLLDKLQNPEQWLESLSKEALTEIFIAQIQDLTSTLPHQAVALLENQSKLHHQRFEKYCALLQELKTLPPQEINRQFVRQRRHQVKTWLLEIEDSALDIQRAVENLKSFNAATFQTQLDALINEPGRSNTSVFQNVFDSIQKFVNELQTRITGAVKIIEEFATKLINFINKGLEKAEEIGNKVIAGVTGQLEKARDGLKRVTVYLTETLERVSKFIEEAADNTARVVKPLKDACSTFSATVTGKLEYLSGQLEEKVKQLQDKLKGLTNNIATELNQKSLEDKIRALLSQITDILQSESVKNAIEKADQGIDKVIAALDKVTLKPVFQTVVTKTDEVGVKLKTVNVSTMSTAKKAALKVALTVIKEVDVPGTVNPELISAFNSIVDPAANLVKSIKAEADKVKETVDSFAPGVLVSSYLKDPIESLVIKLNDYKPSKLLEPVKQTYNGLIDKLGVLNPNQLLDRLQKLYKQLEDLIASLKPEKLQEFFNNQRDEVKAFLDKIPVKEIEEKVMAAINDAQKLLGGLGLDSVLNSSFWQTVTEILNTNLDSPIAKLDEFKENIAKRVNNLDERRIKPCLQELRSAVDSYAENADNAVKNQQNSLNDSWQNYQKFLSDFVNQWGNNWATIEVYLRKTEVPVEAAFDWQDLLTRLQTLHSKLGEEQQALETAKKSVDKFTATSAVELAKITPDLTDDKIIANFKQAIPGEIEVQLIGPVKSILTTVNTTLKMLKNSILKTVESVITTIKEVPERLANKLTRIAQTLSQEVQKTINSLKTNLDEVVNGANKCVANVYSSIMSILKQLRPLLVLNSFYGESDFKFGKQGLIKLFDKLRQKNDCVSIYFWELVKAEQKQQLEGGDLQVLLAEPTTQKVFLNALNDLLTSNLWQDKAKELEAYNDKLTPALKSSMAENENSDMDESLKGIRRNRLWLEVLFPEEIVPSLQSLFPFFQEKLRGIYPQALVDNLDELHQEVVKLIHGLPEVIEKALQAEYEKVKEAYGKIDKSIQKLFEALLRRLESIRSEFGIGLEDVSDAYNRLLNALPL